MKKYCDGCSKYRNDVIAVGKDYNGEPDAPDYCFICRKESERDKFFSKKYNKYIRFATYGDDY